MPGQEEALERARLAQLRQQLNVERNDHTTFRGWADEAFRDPLFGATRSLVYERSTLPREELERNEQALSAGVAGLATAGLGAVVGAVAHEVLPQDDLRLQEQERILQRAFGELDPSLRSNGKLYEEVRNPGLVSTRHNALLDAVRYRRDPKPPAAGTDPSFRVVDWDWTERELGRVTPDRVATVTNVPQAGPDLGGFARGWDGPEGGNRVAYTVVPEVNSGRFSQKLLPALVDRVYGRDARIEWVDEDGIAMAPKARRREINLPDRQPVERPVSRDRLHELKPGQRAELLERMAPGQTRGSNQSGYIWGTLTDRPRYGYGVPLDRTTTNPEVIVSEVRTPPELETKYLYTEDSRDPFVEYNLGRGNRAVGPSWGSTEPPTAPTPAVRRKRDVAGDISFRGDLIERRGGFSLADAQAVQSKLGLPVSFARAGAPAASALENAVESIRTAEALPSHGAVIERYARSLPRLGATTSPRQPAIVRMSAMPLDTRVGVTSKLRKSLDLPSALEGAGYEPTQSGLRQANADVVAAAGRRVNRLNTAARLAPAVGVLTGLADPQAAELVGAALREEGAVRAGLLRDAVRVYGQNAVVGGIQGGLAGAMIRALPAAAPRLGLAGRLATAGVSGLGIAAPALTGIAIAQTADSYLKGATGEGLTAHTRRAQQQAQPALRDPVNAVFPTPRAVMAQTPSGVAQLRPASPVNPVIQEARNRVALFQRNFNPLRGDLGLTELLFGRGRGQPFGGRSQRSLKLR